MPRIIHKLVKIENNTDEKILTSMMYEEALEEALHMLGWQVQSYYDDPYNNLQMELFEN